MTEELRTLADVDATLDALEGWLNDEPGNSTCVYFMSPNPPKPCPCMSCTSYYWIDRIREVRALLARVADPHAMP